MKTGYVWSLPRGLARGRQQVCPWVFWKLMEKRNKTYSFISSANIFLGSITLILAIGSEKKCFLGINMVNCIKNHRTSIFHPTRFSNILLNWGWPCNDPHWLIECGRSKAARLLGQVPNRPHSIAWLSWNTCLGILELTSKKSSCLRVTSWWRKRRPQPDGVRGAEAHCLRWALPQLQNYEQK